MSASGIALAVLFVIFSIFYILHSEHRLTDDEQSKRQLEVEFRSLQEFQDTQSQLLRLGCEVISIRTHEQGFMHRHPCTEAILMVSKDLEPQIYKVMADIACLGTIQSVRTLRSKEIRIDTGY